MIANQEFNLIRSKELKYITAYLHSQNADGSYNVCFNLSTLSPKRTYKYTKSYLEEFYTLDGTIKWVVG